MGSKINQSALSSRQGRSQILLKQNKHGGRAAEVKVEFGGGKYGIYLDYSKTQLSVNGSP